MDPATAQQVQQHGLRLVAAMMGRRHRASAAARRHREQTPIPLATCRLLYSDPGMDIGRSLRDRNDLELQVERIGKACGRQRFLSGRCSQPVVDVNEYRRDAKRRLNPPQCGGERQRVAPAGESDDNPILGCKSCVARAGQ
jgi:hypothetical protein